MDYMEVIILSFIVSNMCVISNILKDLMTQKCTGVKTGRCSKRGTCDGGCALFVDALMQLKDNKEILKED